MNDVPPSSSEPGPLTAVARTSLWSRLVWCVPLAALLIVVLLGVRALADRGIDVVVTFDQAAGARVDDTKVIYLGAEAGHVTKIQVNADGRRIDMTLRLDPRAKRALTTTTKFWLVGAKPTLSDISSVKAAVAGLTIGVAPGIGGAPARHFDGLGEPPVVMPGTAGTGYVLHANDLGAARTGSAIYFHGQEVGRITATRFVAPAAFDLDIFVFAPYDQLMRPSARFWVASAIQVALGDKGVTANVERLNAVFNGSLELELPEDAGGVAASPAGAGFTLYPNEEDADAGPTGPDVLYAFSFKGPGGELNVGAPVRLLGFQVGVVKSVRLVVDPATGEPGTAAIAALWPLRLRVAGSGAAQAASRAAADVAVERLLALGYRATLVQKPPLIGGRIIALAQAAGAAPARLGAASARIDDGTGVRAADSGSPRTFPSVDSGSGSLDETTGQLNQLLAKLNRVPIEQIGNDVHQAVASMNRIVSSPELASSLHHLDQTLAQAEQMFKTAQPQLGPLLEKLNQAATELTATVTAARGVMTGEGADGDASVPDAIRQLNEAARSVRSLSDYLGRHPESLIRGRHDATSEAPTQDSR